MVIKERRGRHDNIMSLRRSTAAAQQIKIINKKKNNRIIVLYSTV